MILMLINVATAGRGEQRAARAAEAQDALAFDQQPNGGAPAAAHAGGGSQADARGKPAAGRSQPSLSPKRRQTR